MIKVNTHAMETGYDRLNQIEAWLDDIGNIIGEATTVLRKCVDGGVLTDIMVISLRQQAQSVRKQRDSVKQMANVLQSVTEQYEKCETDAKNETLSDLLVALKPIWEIIRPLPSPCPIFVLRLDELKIIDTYISPLITTGENAV